MIAAGDYQGLCRPESLENGMAVARVREKSSSSLEPFGSFGRSWLSHYNAAMPNQPVQNLKNHVKFVPAFHAVALPIFMINALWTLRRASTRPSWDTGIAALVGIALVILALFARVFALRVQDRVIRLEMRLRMRESLPSDLAARIPEFTIDQLVALRFASDAELPALARRVLDERLNDRKAIKLLIKDWQADHSRA